MRYGFPMVAASLLLAAGCAEPTPVSGPSESTPAPLLAAGREGQAPDRYIVVFRASVADVDRATDEVMRGAGGQVHLRYRAALKGFAATIPAAALDGIRRNPNVEYVEADGIASIIVEQTLPGTNSQWGLDRIDQRDRPLNQKYVYEKTGSGVRAYILDTGIRYTHQEFGGRAVSGPDFVSSDNFSEDCHGHGTHVAGTVGGATVGVAKAVTLVGVRVLGCSGSGSYAGIIGAVDWVTQQKQANAGVGMVGNMSLGGGVSSALNTAVNNSVSAGVVWAVAAGNENSDACTRSPASAASALTTGASTSSDARSSFSNFGTCVDLFAPGSSIYSSTYNGDNTYASWNGTSMATPHVAGVAALLLQGNGSASAASINSAVTGNASVGKLTSIGTNSPNLLLYSLGPAPDPGENQAPTAAFTSSCSGLTCTFNASGSTDDNGIVSYNWTFGDGSSATGVTASRTYGAAGDYLVTLTVTDAGGLSDDQATPVSVSEPVIVPVHVAALSATTQKAGKNWKGIVTVTVRNNVGGLVSGATVSGNWSTGGSASCITGATGTCSMTSATFKSNVASTTWAVTGLSGPGLSYNSSANVASSIVVTRP